VALHRVREQLFDAAERVLLRGGPSALTSRAVTAEANCAKGVLHKHFADFDGFLIELVADRIARLGPRSARLRSSAGTRTVVENVAEVLTELFGSVALSIVALIIARDDLRTRLRATRPTGVPVLSEAATMIAGYLDAEREAGRIAPSADVDLLALTLIGSGHLVFAGRDGEPPEPGEVIDLVTSILGGALT